MRKWASRLRSHHGIMLCSNGSTGRLTNLRYADDLLLFAFSASDALFMLEALQAELDDNVILEAQIKRLKKKHKGRKKHFYYF